jgi:3-phytase
MGKLKKFIFIISVCFAMLSAQPTINISAKATTSPTGFDVDDCAIWVHPSDPSKSLVIINDKGPMTEKGGLYVYNLSGVLVQKVRMQQPQNPDLRYNVVFDSDTMDVLVCVDRGNLDTAYNKVRVFKINADNADASSGFLSEITTEKGIPTGQTEAYGHGLYLRPSDGALFSIVTANSLSDFTQLRLQGDGAGKVTGSIVRKWGKTDIRGDLCEGTCVDDEWGFIYICDEDYQVLKYEADPDNNDNAAIGKFALRDGISLDREGINIYRCGNKSGYILVSSQGNNQIKVYDRVTNAFLGTVIPEGMKDCDGLDVTATPLGPKFPHGMAAFHLGTNVGSQFSFYDWSDIATGLNLAAPCDAERPKGFKGSGIRNGKNLSAPDFQKSLTVAYIGNSTMLRIHAPRRGCAEITLHDLQGRTVKRLFKNFQQSNEVEFCIPAGIVRSGAYVIKCSLNNFAFINDLVMVK